MTGAPPESACPVVFTRYGDGALLASIAHVVDERRDALLAYLKAHPGVADAYLTEQHALVIPTDAPFPTTHEGWWLDRATAGPSTCTLHTLSLRWDGADLPEAARLFSRSPEALAHAYMAPVYAVCFLGFRPGFAYLRGVPEGLRLPRRDQVRARVPRNTFALGGPYAGIYPCASPGGFWLLATATDVTLFEREGPRAGPLLRPGDRVRFVEAAR